MTDNSENGQPRIWNFNQAEFLGPTDFSNLPCCSEAPEVKSGTSYNHKVDMWAFGILLHEMATGKDKPVFFNDMQLELPGCSETFLDLLYKCLNPDYNLRISSSACLKHEWFKIKTFNTIQDQIESEIDPKKRNKLLLRQNSKNGPELSPVKSNLSVSPDE